MRCKVGDMAFTRAHADGVTAPTEYIGRLVEVVAFSGTLDEARTVLPGAWWFVRPLGWRPRSCRVRADGCFEYPDALLRPIRPDAEPIDALRDVPADELEMYPGG